MLCAAAAFLVASVTRCPIRLVLPQGRPPQGSVTRHSLQDLPRKPVGNLCAVQSGLQQSTMGLFKLSFLQKVTEVLVIMCEG